MYSLRLEARLPSSRERVVVVSEDPGFWLALRQEAPELGDSWVLAHSARECLVSIEDPRARLIVLDGALRDKPADQLLQLVRQIKPDLPIVFAFADERDDTERRARTAGVLYYGDRAQLRDVARVIRQTIRRPTRAPGRKGRGDARTESSEPEIV